jgi:hypothetical protein
LKTRTAFKVLRNDLTSVGLLGACRKQYGFNVCNKPNEPLSAHPRRGGGLWVTPTISDAKAIRRYVAKRHRIETRIFRCRIGRVLYETSCRIKTDCVIFSPEDEIKY